MREQLMTAMKEAMKAKEMRTVQTIRMVQAAIKDLDIANRTAGKPEADNGEIAGLLSKLVKTREESAKIYAENNRPELADQERAEIAVITSFMPKQLSEAEVADAIKAAIAEAGAASIKDMGKVMAVLKAKFPGQMDFGKASAAIKAALG